MKGQGVQAIYGPKADVLKSDIQDVLDSGEVIPETLPSQMTAVQKAEATFKGVTDEVHSVADGQVINIEDVKDPVFSQKMMGDGFAVEPENGKIVSPVAGKVTSIFPTKHALGLVTDNGLEVLVHIGLDTVSLEGKPKLLKVKQLLQVISWLKQTLMLSVKQVVKHLQLLSLQMQMQSNQLK